MRTDPGFGKYPTERLFVLQGRSAVATARPWGENWHVFI
jgi:hypothetical protein